MSFADDLINSKKKKKKGESFADEVISGGYDAMWATEYNKVTSKPSTTKKQEDIAPIKPNAIAPEPTVKEDKNWISSFLTNAGAIGSNLLSSAATGILQFGKTVAMRNDEQKNMFAESHNEILDKAIQMRKEKGIETAGMENLYREKIDSKGIYQEKIDKLNQKMVENTEKATNPVTKKVAELSQSIGNTLVGIGVTAVNPAAGFTYFTGSATGSYYDEGIRRGMTEEEAKMYGGVMGTLEGVTEKFLAGQNIKGVKAILEGQGAKKALAAFGIEIGENFLQEAVMPSLSEITAATTAGKEHLNYDFSTEEGWQNLLKDSFSDGVDGALSAILVGGTTRGVASATRVVNKINNGQSVTQEEVATAIHDSQEAGVNVEEILQEEITRTAENRLVQENVVPVENEAQVEGLQQEITAKQDELNQAQDPREQQIIQEEIEVLQEELNEVTNAQQITEETIQENEQLDTTQNEVAEEAYHLADKQVKQKYSQTVDISKLDVVEQNGGGKRNIQYWLDKIKQDGGVIDPIEVAITDNGKYKIYDGHHRLQAAQELGIKEIPVAFIKEGHYTDVPSEFSVDTNTQEITPVQDAPTQQDTTEQETTDEDIIPETQEEIKRGKEWTNKVQEQDKVNRPLAIEQSKATGNNTMVGYSPILSNNKLYHKGTLSWVTPEGKLDSKVINESEIDSFLSKNKIDRLENGISPFDNGLSEVVAPLQEAIENLTEQVKAIQENIAPTSQEVVEQQGQEAFNAITDEQAPIAQEDTTPEVETGEITGNKAESPLENRDIDEVGNRKVKAYQYENPEVRPYFQTEAQNMIHDLDNTIKGEKGMTQDELGNTEFYGTTRQTAEAIAYLKDNYGYSYEQIRKGLNDIIEDNGKENNAVAKRIEFMLDERLREGYTTSDGIPIPPNEDYIKFLEEKNITEYNQKSSESLATTDKYTPTEPIQETIPVKEIATQVEEVIAPLEEKIEKLTEQLDTVVNSLEEQIQAPIKATSENVESAYDGSTAKPENMTEQEYQKFLDTPISKTIEDFDYSSHYGKVQNEAYNELREIYNNAKKGNLIQELEKAYEINDNADKIVTQDETNKYRVKLKRGSSYTHRGDIILTKQRIKESLLYDLIKRNGKYEGSMLENILDNIAPIAQNPFELTEEQNSKIQELRADTQKWKDIYSERYDDKKFAQKRIKGVAMQNAAEIRDITQGDWLIPIEGGLTETELSNRIVKLNKNYIGKQVLVDGMPGEIVSNAYGKVGVKFEDGTTSYFTKDKITPATNISELIKQQKEMYEQHQTIAPDVQESPTINQNTQEQQLIPMTETTAQNQNTELADTSTETQEQEKIAEILSERPTQENKKQRLWAKFRAAVFDKGSVFEDLSIKNKNRELMSKWDYMLTAEARAQSAMINGHKQFDSETKTETQITKSLNDIQTEVGDKVQEFSEYLYHKHNISRMSLEANAQAQMTELQETALAEYDTEAIEKLSRKRITEKTDEETAALIETAKEYVRLSEVKNKPVFGNSVTADISKDIVNEYEMNNPEFMDWAKDVYAYNKANLDQLVQSGVISQETADQFAEIYPDYVPIGRANKNGNAVNVPLDTNRTGINAPIARAKGGNGDILPLFDTMAKRTIQTYRAVAKNNFGVELKNTLNSTVENQQTNVDEILDNVDQQESLLQEGKDGKAPTFTVFENGEKVTYEITQDMYEALKPVSDSSLLSTTFKPFNKISNFHRGVLTEYNPVFMLTNSIKDFQDVLLNSQHAAKTYSKFGESYAQILKKGYWYKEYMANGGEQNSYFDSQEGTFNAERKGMAKVLDTFPLKQISQLNNVIEMAPRLAEYIASRESGRSIETSMLDAARVTTNFKAGGDLTKWANRNGATFLNASVQGAMQQVRNVREANMNGLKGYANLATKFALAGVPALLLNAMLWGDDEEYEELSDYVKQSYWIVGKYGDGNFIRIPKGRMVTVIQESFNQIKNAITGDDEVDLGQFLEVMATNIAPNNPIENNVLSPIIQAVTNKAWYGDDLVPTRLQSVPAEEQYDESIDKLSIALGQSLGISPYKINYILDQYSGGIGDVFLPMMTPQAETSSDSAGSKLIAPLTSKFSVDSVMKNQNTSDLYELSEELTAKANSSKATDEDILKNKFINTAKAAMNELYKQKREVQNSDIPDSEKYNQVREIQKQINEMAESSIRDYEDIDMKSNYADVGGVEYYKNNDGEWTKVRDKEALELNELGMTSSTKNTYFETKNEINKLAGIVEDSKDSITIEDEDSDEYKEAIKYLSSEKKKDIVNKIIDSGLKDKEKAYLYKKFYNSDTVDTMVNTGINVDDYLIYTTKEFEADYNDKGNAISGSRKNKVVSYVNSLEMNIPQKAILIKATNTFKFNDYNNDIVSYVSNLDLEYTDKVKLLKDLDMTVTDDGTVKWK